MQDNNHEDDHVRYIFNAAGRDDNTGQVASGLEHHRFSKQFPGQSSAQWIFLANNTGGDALAAEFPIFITRGFPVVITGWKC
jgi:hypothetical protein